MELENCRKIPIRNFLEYCIICILVEILILFFFFVIVQVTDLFLKGHSNSSVEIIGLGGNILGGIQKGHFL